MQGRKRTDNSKAPDRISQQVNALQLRILQAKGRLLAKGTDTYMPFLEIQATAEGRELDAEEKLALRQVWNLRIDAEDIPKQTARVEFIERAFAQAAA